MHAENGARWFEARHNAMEGIEMREREIFMRDSSDDRDDSRLGRYASVGRCRGRRAVPSGYWVLARIGELDYVRQQSL